VKGVTATGLRDLRQSAKIEKEKELLEKGGQPKGKKNQMNEKKNMKDKRKDEKTHSKAYAKIPFNGEN